MDLATAKTTFADLIDDCLSDRCPFDQIEARFGALKKELLHVPEDKSLDRAFESMQHYLADADIREKDELYGAAYGEGQRESLRRASAQLRKQT